MNTKALEDKLRVLKMDYVRIQGDVEKIESVGGNSGPAVKEMERIEKEIQEIKTKLRSK